MINRLLFAFGVAVLIVQPLAARAEADIDTDHPVTVAGGEIDGSDRLLIVNGNTGHVIYDDGRDDLFCVIRRATVGYHDNGRPIRKPVMRCR